MKLKQLKPAIHEVLINDWDPIGIGDKPMAQDEYDSYIPSIFRMLKNGADVYKLSKHLGNLEKNSMGISEKNDTNKIVAKKLIELVSK